jgi:transposase
MPQTNELHQQQKLQSADAAHSLLHAQALIAKLQAQIQTQQTQLKYEQTRSAALNLEVARLKQWRFGSSSESMDDSQASLFDAKTLAQIAQEASAEDRAQSQTQELMLDADKRAKAAKKTPKRQALPSQLERIEHHYEIEPATCSMGHPLTRIGQEISEQLDCVPAQFFVHRHIRGKYACACCQTVLAASMPAQIIDKGIPAPGLLAQVIVAKHDDHLPLYRQEEIYRRSGAFIARSSMASWMGQCGAQLEPLVQALREHVFAQGVVHADETPLDLLAPGTGKTHQAYAWVYRTSDLGTSDLEQRGKEGHKAQRAVVFDFCTSRAGSHAKAMLKDFTGTLLVDDYSGYKALFKEQLGQASSKIMEAGCWAHARRKFFEAHKHTQSEIARQALEYIGQLYAIEDKAREQTQQQRWQLRQTLSVPLLERFKAWLMSQRVQLAKADATAKAIDYTLSRWAALMLHTTDARIPVDNNAVENAIRPLALGRKNWLFVGSQQAGERAANLMSLIESAKLNGHDAWAYLKDILTKLPTWPNSRLHELLPHRWSASTT